MIDASQAGTSMRMSLLRMAKPTAKGKAEMDKLGVSLTDAKGEFVGLPALIGQFQTGLKGMTKEQKLATISNVVGTEASSAFLTLIDAGPKKLDKYSKSLKDSDGASAKAAKQMKDNLKGSVEQLMGAMESLGLIIGESLTPFLRGLATAVSWVVDRISGMPKWMIMVATIMGLIAAAIGPVLVGLGLLVQAIGWIAASGPAMAIIGGIWTGIKVAAVALVGPIGWIIAGIALLTAGFIIAYKKSETFRNIVSGAIRGVVGAFQFLWNGIKTIGSAIGSFITGNILGPMIAFAQSIGNTLRAFWGQNGPMIIQAVQNIWAVVGPVLTTMFNFFKTIFMSIVSVAGAYLRMIWMVAQPILIAFSQSFMAIWNFIKLQFMNVWNMITGIFSGVLNVILGLVKIFGGVFTGNWSAVWSGLGQVVTGLLGIILAPIKFLFNTIKNTLGLFGTIFIAVWRGIWGALKGVVVGVMNIVVTIFKSIWNNLLAFLKFIGAVFLSVTRGIWNGIKFAIVNPIKAASGGVKVILNGLKTFFVWIWNGISSAVMSAVKGIGNVIRTIFNGINTFIRWIFNGIGNFIKWVWNSKILAPIRWAVQAINVVVRIVFAAIGKFIRFIFNGIASFIKWVWNGIKNSIMFYVNLIKKLVTAAWNILSRVTRAIFNGVKAFLIWVWKTIGVRVVNHVKALWNSIKYYWNIVSSFTRKIFNSVKNFMIWVWNSVKNKVVSIVRSLWNTVRGIWNALASGTRKVFNSIRSFLTWLWTIIRNKVTSIVRSLWNGVRGTWNNLTNGTKRIFNGVRNYLVDKWNGIKNSVTGIASDLWASVKQTFTNMKNGLGGLADKIGGVITGMVKGIKKGLNSLIKGVNWVAKKLGVDQKIPELSTGTSGASYAGSGVGAGVSNGVVSSGGFATVNDRGPGNGSGPGGHQEVIQRADGSMIAPKGKNVTVPLGKGDIVHSGKAVQRAQKAGVLPKFSRGTTNKKKYDLLKDQKKQKHNHSGMDAIGTGLAKNSAWGVSGGGTLENLGKALVGTAKEGGKKAVVGSTKKAADTTKKGKEAVDTGKKVAEAAGKSAAKISGDLLEYVGNPGKLVSAMLKKFGVDFGNVKGQIPKDMMWDPMWKGLKGGVKSLFDGWLTEADGAGDGGYVDLSKGINFGFGFPPGYPFNRPHNGLDINYKYGEKLYSTLGGTATAKSGYNGGFGNSMWIKSGAMQAIYGHMSKLAFSGSKKVKPGSYLGLSGGDPSRQGRSAGDSTGPHLHYEMRKNGKPFDPTKWLKENNGGGGSKSASKWKGDIKKAAKATGVSLSGGKLNDIVKLIATESNGNSKVKQQVQDVNSGSNAARGLLQYTPGTFKGYATKNGKNILNGMHQLKAFFNNSNWSSDLAAWKSRMARGSTGWGPTGGRRGYAKGTDSARSGLANVFEKGGEIMNLRGGEQIIPNDVSINALKSMMSSDLFSRTQSAVYAGISRYAEALERKQEQKRIKELQAQQQANANTTDINELKQMMGQMVYLMQQQLGVQEDIAGTNNAIANKSNVMDLEKTTQKVSEQEAFNLLMSRYNSGLKMD